MVRLRDVSDQALLAEIELDEKLDNPLAALLSPRAKSPSVRSIWKTETTRRLATGG
jgi:hypothetical protein